MISLPRYDIIMMVEYIVRHGIFIDWFKTAQEDPLFAGLVAKSSFGRVIHRLVVLILATGVVPDALGLAAVVSAPNSGK